jgi:hypothetical protein
LDDVPKMRAVVVTIPLGGINLCSGAAREQHLADEAKSLRAEAECLPPGDLRNAVEEIAQYAEMLLSKLRKSREEQRPPA